MMLKLTNEEATELYNSMFPAGMLFVDIADEIDKYNGEYKYDLRYKFCDVLIDTLLRGRFVWNLDTDFDNNDIIELCCAQVDMLGEFEPFYCAMASFFQKDFKKCLYYIDMIYLDYNNKDSVYSAEDIGFYFLSPFKNAFPGFWGHIRRIFSTRKIASGVFEMIDAIEAFYENKSPDLVIDKLSKVIQIDNECITAKELLAYTYFQNKMWYNAISCYEQIEEPIILYFDDLYFNMAWAYEKVKEYDNSEKYYKKCLEIRDDYTFATNNLGYLYIRKKEFSKAIATLKKCIGKGYTLEERKLASNNLVFAYIGAGLIEEAQDFVSKCKIKLRKNTIEKIESAKKNGNNHSSNNIDLDAEKNAVDSKKVIFNEKTYQFSSEKILEDELALRIESGQPVFGRNLKMYRKKGEYGRQYIFEKGRLDLLTEDENGDLYIIELKKDSGYDDPYKQIVEYIDWFIKHKATGKQKVYGIICLNSPKESLISAVKHDNRIQLFEYAISYNEIK